MGGLSLQEIYYNIPGAHILATEDGNDVYEVAIQKLDEYFSPKQSRVFERHIFRLMKQEPEEKFEKFLVRLRNQAEKCKFQNLDENLIDQIVEKGNCVELRKKILAVGDTITLDKLISEANSLEVVKRQLGEFSGNPGPIQEVNLLHQKPTTSRYSSSISSCGRCGSKEHFSSSDRCPAINQNCLRCGFKGHYRNQCKTAAKNKKRKGNYLKQGEIQRNNKRKRTNVHSIEEDPNDETDYVFHIDQDETITCNLGGVQIEMLIDSGSRSNLISDKDWQNLKSLKVRAVNQVRNPDKTFMSYASKEPLDVLGSFDASITAGGETTSATFYVIKDGNKSLLGKKTAMALGVLRIGPALVNATATTFPKFKNVLVDIPIDESVKPVCQPYRRMPIPLEAKVNAKLDELIASDIIETVSGPSRWVSPIVPVLKENGDVRICVDMRRANTAIIRENHPLPTMDQLLPKVGQAKIFSRLDIKNAFHQVEISPSSRYITTFISSQGLLRYKRLMFGISCAPEIFQKLMERILIKCEGTLNFIDDILIFGATMEEHDNRLKETTKTLEENNILLNKAKCVFRMKQVEFLGHQLSSEGVKPLDSYIGVIKTFRPPRTIEEIQSFLGLVNYVGKWIPNLATLTEPLRKLLRMKLAKQSNIEKLWSVEQQNAFNKLKQILSEIKTLGYYNPNDKTQVIADASPVGLGCALIQLNNSGPRIIAFGNKSLTDCEKRYCQTEKEALALVWAVEHFHMYLYGKHEFELVTDHKPLEIIFGPKSRPCARIERWVLRLQSYNYKVVYRPGKSNIADPLSRLPSAKYAAKPFDEESVHQIVNYSRPNAIPLSTIKKISEKDEEIIKVKKGVFSDQWDTSVNQFKIFQTELCFHEGILLRGNRIVVPCPLRRQVLEAAHEGHPGIVAMKNRLRTKVWWPRIDADAEKLVKSCKGCTLVSAPNPPNPMKRREFPTQPWVAVAIDFLGPLPSKEHIFVIVDYYSRYKEVKIMRDITANSTINVLQETFSRLGYPSSMNADNGGQLISQELIKYCEEGGIILHHTIPYWPQQNGEVERQNRDLLKRIRISYALKKNWKKELLDYMMMYNSTPHTSTGKTPSELFFGRQFRDKLPNLGDIENNELDGEVRDKDKLMKEKGKDYGDRKRRAAEIELQPGDKVYVKNLIKENKTCPNFNPTQHTVLTKNGGDVQVRNDETGKDYRRNIVHLKKVEGEWKVCDKIGRDNAPPPDKEQDVLSPDEAQDV